MCAHCASAAQLDKRPALYIQMSRQSRFEVNKSSNTTNDCAHVDIIIYV
jgi:hypothetical protein